MNKAVMVSIRPKWCEKIIKGEKTFEVRKTCPKMEPPFKCYIYCTISELLTKSHFNGTIYVASSKRYKPFLEKHGNVTYSGKIIGEFVCDRIIASHGVYGDELDHTGLSYGDLLLYGKGGNIYGWHISDLNIYDVPKRLSEFKKADCKCQFPELYDKKIVRAPQSWYYVEELI